MAEIIAIFVIILVVKIIMEQKYKQLETEILKELGYPNWNVISYFDEYVIVKSRQALEKYDDIKFFKENREKIVRAEDVLKRKMNIAINLRNFLENNEYKSRSPSYKANK